jgi:hypothetical protein
MPTPNTEYCHKSTRTEIPKFKLTCYPARKRRRGLWATGSRFSAALPGPARPPRRAFHRSATGRRRLPALQFLMKCIDPGSSLTRPALVKSAITGEARVLSAVSEPAQPLP